MTIRFLKWRNCQRICMEQTVPDGKERKNMEELFSDFHGDYEPIKIDWGIPEGKEIW